MTVNRQTIALENTDAYSKLRSALVSGTVISPAQQDIYPLINNIYSLALILKFLSYSSFPKAVVLENRG